MYFYLNWGNEKRRDAPFFYIIIIIIYFSFSFSAGSPFRQLD